MHRIALLGELHRRHPEGITRTPHGALIFEVGPTNRLSEVLALLEDARPGKARHTPFMIDLARIGVLTPSAASAIAGAAANIVQSSHMPVVFVNAAPEVLRGLADCRHMKDNPTPPLFVIDTEGQGSYIGVLPDRLRSLLEVLPPGGASASMLAGKCVSSKRDVNRYSVYLQELYNYGLACREKVPGSERDGGERGWTYVYSPAVSSITECPNNSARSLDLAGRQ